MSRAKSSMSDTRVIRKILKKVFLEITSHYTLFGVVNFNILISKKTKLMFKITFLLAFI